MSFQCCIYFHLTWSRFYFDGRLQFSVWCLRKHRDYWKRWKLHSRLKQNKTNPSTFTCKKENSCFGVRCKGVTHNSSKIQYIRKTHSQNVQFRKTKYCVEHPCSCLFLTFLFQSSLHYQFSLIPLLHVSPSEDDHSSSAPYLSLWTFFIYHYYTKPLSFLYLRY